MVTTDRTFLVRVMLALLLVGIVVGVGVLYLLSEESVRIYPELSHLQIPIFIAVIIGLIPILLGILATFSFLKLVDRGEAFSRTTAALFRRLKFLLGLTAGYLILGFFGVAVAVGQVHPGGLLVLLGGLIVVLFLLALASLLEELFADARELRAEREATI